MSRPQDLEQSRLAGVIEQVEQGEAVDVDHVLALQKLDVARDGELFVADALRREDEEYEWCKRFLEKQGA